MKPIIIGIGITFLYFLAGYSVLTTPLLMSPILFIFERQVDSSYRSRQARYQLSHALISILASHS
jgi:hypothetical protein